MFEQFSIAEKHTNPWAVMVSFTAQAAVAAAVVLLSIIQFQKLDPGALVLQPPPLFAPSPLREAVSIVAVERSGVAPRFTTAAPPRPLVVPTRIPDKVAYIDDGPQTPVISMSDLLEQRRGAGQGSSSGVPFATTQAPDGVAPPPAARPETPKPADRAPIRIGGNVLEARILRKVVPIYPPLARQMRISGVVRMVGVIAKDGRVQNLEIIDGHPLLVPAAVDAVRQWLYRPTLLNFEPVAVIAPIEVRFQLAP
ncbi:MAG TPA: energy transducer TonB [Bryobacteraceae bacterium]|nr:energy transducer TonB [Bryobacteraceae bacterium]